MSRQVRHFNLPNVPGPVGVEMPGGLERMWRGGPTALCVRDAGTHLDVWILVDPKAPQGSRWFFIAATGHGPLVPPGFVYVGSALRSDDRLSTHVFFDATGVGL